ncbi:MAG: MBL fold metallo-hydrolase [Planctomycetota bacterium]|nr:MBL fold metallo-hydrolase [Planctomycetota bacterium]
MKIEFVNHASFIIESEGVRLITDPWLGGTSFDNGWRLLSKTALPYEAWHSITHLWFSHEHPDHFSPFCIRKIPEEARKNITVYFQETGDRKVVEYCKKMKFKDVIEMPRGKTYQLAPNVEIMCYDWVGFDDSWCYIKTPQGTLLNLNDCTVNTIDEMKYIKDIVGEVDVLCTQFSISAWDGNIDELDRRLDGSRIMLERTVNQTNIFKAKYVIPFASYIWFCHEENSYMNQAFLPIEEIASTLQEKTEAQLLMMYPGDTWTIGETFDHTPALARYKEDQDSISTRPLFKADKVAEDELIRESHAYCRKIAKDASPSKLRMHLAKKLVHYRRQRDDSHWGLGKRLDALLAMMTLQCEPARIHVTDLNKSYLFDIFQGLRSTSLTEDECDVAVGSQALFYSFKFLWGGETLHINGRFRRILANDRGPLFHFYSLAGEQNAGKPVTWKTLPGDLKKKLGLGSS